MDWVEVPLVIGRRAVPLCPVCGSHGTYFYQGLTDQLFSAPGDWSFRRCRNEACGSFWLDPAPRTEDLGEAYNEYYTHLAPGRLHRLFTSVVRGLISIPLLPLGVPRARRESRAMFLTERVPGSLLDIGCGGGDFLALMRTRGWRVKGLEFDSRAAESARGRYGVDVHVGTMADLLGNGECFDAVTASHVIEHVPNPRAFLAEAAELVGGGGCIVLKTPNAASFGHRRFGQYWRGLEPPRHLQVFTPKSLSLLAEDVGLTGRVWTSAAGADYILSSSYFLSRSGHFRSRDLSLGDRILAKGAGLFYAARAQGVLHQDPLSGEEICSMLELRTSSL